MSKVSSKRNRKSKLTPRNYEINEENITDLQSPSTNIASTQKSLNGPLASTFTHTHDDFEALIDSQNKPKEAISPQLEFSVTVAVEEFDENSSDLIIVEPKEQSPVVISCSDSEADDTIDIGTENRTSTYTNELAKDLPDKLPGLLVLDRNEILNATNAILEKSSNIADKILGIEVRNCIGQFRTSFRDELEGKIQSVLIRFLQWQKLIHIRHRSCSPLFYKCYICEKSWWHLNDFREHLTKHDVFELDLEEYTMYEANVIAYSKVEDIIDIKHFNTEGICPKCGNEFVIHKSTNRNKKLLYRCKIVSCKKLFHTCFTLSTHENQVHPASELSDTVQESGTPIYCPVCAFVFHTQKSYQVHMNLMHSVRSDLIVTMSNRCPQCDEQLMFGSYHICVEKKSLVQCNLCYRSFPRGPQFSSHMGQNDYYKCKMCDELLPRQCVETEHLMKHTDKFVLVKKCLMCEVFTVFLDYLTAFDHISVHLNMSYEGITTKYISNILIPKSCLPVLTPNVDIKEEPNDAILAPELNIRQEIMEEFKTDAEEDDQIQIKEEIDIHDDFDHKHIQEQYACKSEKPDISKIFGIKIDASEIDMKQDMQDEEESEYEDDIIKLDFNFLNTMQEAMDVSSQDCNQKIEDTTPEYVEDSREDIQDNEEDMQETVDEKKKYKTPKIYRCHRCGLDAVHKEYRAHLKSHCHEIVYEVDNYPCSKCSSTYETFNEYIDHFTKHNLNPLSCPECYKCFDSHKAIESHISLHVIKSFVTVQRDAVAKKKANFYYKCTLCDETVDKMNFFDHWEKHLSFIEQKTTEVEADSLKSNQMSTEMLDELLDRLLSPDPLFRMKRGCPICVRYFERKNDYKRHLVEHLLSHAYAQHQLYKELRCQICQKGFQKAEKYRKHMRDHGSLREYRCQICDKYFSDSSNYSKHIKLHNKNAYTCDICKKKFQAKISLEKHIVLHNNQKPIFCSPCNKTFYLESAYKKHYRVTHDEKLMLFCCKICRKRFRRLKDKWDHMWYVHKERSHQADCPKCPKSYRRYIDLKTHMKSDHFIDFRHYKLNTKKKMLTKKKPLSVQKVDETETLLIY